MALFSHSWSRRVRLIAAAGAVAIAFSHLVFARTSAGHGEWKSLSQQTIDAPNRNSRLHGQPRPASAPTGSDGEAVELIGTIEAWPAPRQPRPTSAAPKRIDGLVTSLESAES